VPQGVLVRVQSWALSLHKALKNFVFGLQSSVVGLVFGHFVSELFQRDGL